MARRSQGGTEAEPHPAACLTAPSYVSLYTALSRHGLITQIPRIQVPHALSQFMQADGCTFVEAYRGPD